LQLCEAMSHTHDSMSGSQNVGNKLGSKPCVRQSRLYRRNESGNAMKALLGSGEDLQWNEMKCEGAYANTGVYDAIAAYKQPIAHDVHDVVPARLTNVHASGYPTAAYQPPSAGRAQRPSQNQGDDRWKTSSSAVGSQLEKAAQEVRAQPDGRWATSSSSIGHAFSQPSVHARREMKQQETEQNYSRSGMFNPRPSTAQYDSQARYSHNSTSLTDRPF